jgi:hypothetical protein
VVVVVAAVVVMVVEDMTVSYFDESLTFCRTISSQLIAWDPTSHLRT